MNDGVMTEPPIRVLIVDDHDSVRLGLSTALTTVDGLLVVGEATTGGQALELCAQIRPDVVLTEIRLPDGDGIGIIQRIRRGFPQIQVVVLTSAVTGDLRRRALRAGAAAYLQKYVAVGELSTVIRAAHAQRLAGFHPAGATERNN